jgi:tetratricopeptide (TPR) repeat protein
MDCRKSLFPALWLLFGALGCSHTETGPVLPQLHETSPPPLASGSSYAPIKHDVKITKRNPQPETCVAFGDIFADGANHQETGSAAQEQLREKARKAYEQALALDLKCLSAYQSMARLYVDMEDYDHAVAMYQKALQYHPQKACVWFDMGMVQSRRKDWPAALESLGRAVDLDPQNHQYVNTLGFALARAGQYQVALACFSRVNTEAQAHYQLARMLLHLQQPDQCRRYLEIALQKDPTLEPAAALLASILEPVPAQPTNSAPTPAPAPVSKAAPAPVQQVGYTEEEVPAASPASSATPAPAATPAPSAPPGRPIILPPPPSMEVNEEPGSGS